MPLVKVWFIMKSGYHGSVAESGRVAAQAAGWLRFGLVWVRRGVVDRA